MPGPRIVDLGGDRQMLDLGFRDEEGLIAAYLLPLPEGWALIETGPTTCRDHLLRGLEAAGVDRDEVRDVLVTHIHLDHAGGVGALAELLPRAVFHAHELGIPHLADPSRLVAGARRVWGEASDRLWGVVAPTPVPRLHGLRGGETLPLRDGSLQILATPGHAKHHLAFFDTAARAVFTGDGAGVLLEGSSRLRPAVPPPDLDLEQLYASLDLMRQTEPRLVLLSHFGPTPNGAADLQRYRVEVERWRAVALAAARERADVEYIAGRLRELDAPGAAEDRASLVSGYDLAAQGFLRYFRVHGDIPAATA